MENLEEEIFTCRETAGGNSETKPLLEHNLVDQVRQRMLFLREEPLWMSRDFQKTIKSILLFYNFLLSLLGVSMILAGGLFRKQVHVPGITYDLIYVADLLSIVAAVVLFLSLVGGVNALREHPSISTTLVALLCMMLFAETAVSVFLVCVLRVLAYFIRNKMDMALLSYETSAAIRQEWDSVQRDLGCCGVSGYEDWAAANVTVPPSCCPTAEPCTPGEYFRIGCFTVVERALNMKLSLLVSIICLDIIVQILCLTASCLIFKIKRKSKKYKLRNALLLRTHHANQIHPLANRHDSGLFVY